MATSRMWRLEGIETSLLEVIGRSTNNQGRFETNNIGGGGGDGVAHFYQMGSSLPNGYVDRNAPYTLPRRAMSGGEGDGGVVMRACVAA